MFSFDKVDIFNVYFGIYKIDIKGHHYNTLIKG